MPRRLRHLLHLGNIRNNRTAQLLHAKTGELNCARFSAGFAEVSRSASALARLLSALCFCLGVAGIADLIIASGQFAAVDSVIKAIRKADKEAGANATSQPLTNRAATSEYYRPADHYEPRQVIQPAPAYTPRPTFHVSAPHSVPIEKRQPICVVNVIVVQPTSVANEQPLQPPWAVLPWENPVQTAPKVKVVYRPPDINHRAGGFEYRGTALDLFI